MWRNIKGQILILVVLKDNTESLPFGRLWVVLLGGRSMDQLTSGGPSFTSSCLSQTHLRSSYYTLMSVGICPPLCTYFCWVLSPIYLSFCPYLCG